MATNWSWKSQLLDGIALHRRDYINFQNIRQKNELGQKFVLLNILEVNVMLQKKWIAVKHEYSPNLALLFTLLPILNA